MEVLSVIISSNTSILADTDAEDAPAPLLYTHEADTSALLKALPARVVKNLQDQALATENHGHGEGVGRMWGRCVGGGRGG
jgi:gamma-glutamyl hydrolase